MSAYTGPLIAPLRPGGVVEAVEHGRYVVMVERIAPERWIAMAGLPSRDGLTWWVWGMAATRDARAEAVAAAAAAADELSAEVERERAAEAAR